MDVEVNIVITRSTFGFGVMAHEVRHTILPRQGWMLELTLAMVQLQIIMARSE